MRWCISCDNRKTYIVSFILLFRKLLFTAVFFVMRMTLCSTDAHRKWLHKQTWRVNMTQNDVILTSQDKTRSSYLKEGLLLSHGRGLGLKSWTRTVECSKETPDSDVARAVGVCKKLVSAFSNSCKRSTGQRSSRTELVCSSADHPYQVGLSATNDWKGHRAGQSSLTGPENMASGPTWAGLWNAGVYKKGIESSHGVYRCLAGSSTQVFPTWKWSSIFIITTYSSLRTTTLKEGILNYLNEKYDDQTTEVLLDMASLVSLGSKPHTLKKRGWTTSRQELLQNWRAWWLNRQCQQRHPPLTSAEAARDEWEVPAKRQKKNLSSYFKKKAKQSQTDPQSSRESIAKELNLCLQTMEAGPEDTPTGMVEAASPLVAKLAKKYCKCPIRAGVQYKWEDCDMS